RGSSNMTAWSVSVNAVKNRWVKEACSTCSHTPTESALPMQAFCWAAVQVDDVLVNVLVAGFQVYLVQALQEVKLPPSPTGRPSLPALYTHRSLIDPASRTLTALVMLAAVASSKPLYFASAASV